MDEECNIIIYKIINNNEIPLKKFPPLPEDRCRICQFPTKLSYCRYHKPFEIEGFPRLIESVNIIGYYSTDFQGKPNNLLTKMIQKAKKEIVNEEILDIFSEIINFTISEKKIPLDLITFVPSRPDHNSLKKIIEAVAKYHKIIKVNSEDYIKLENFGLTRDINDFQKRREFIKHKFIQHKNVRKNQSLKGNILILDDLINTGWTLSRVALILKNSLPNISKIFAFCLGRIIPKGKLLQDNLKF